MSIPMFEEMPTPPIGKVGNPDNSLLEHSATNRLLVSLMDRVECGLLACGPQGELLHANLAARRALKEASVLHLAGMRVCASPRHQGAWSLALDDAAQRRRCNLVEVGDGKARAMLAVMPGNADVGSRPVVVVVMGCRSPCSLLGLEMFSVAHGLTLAEARVLRALVDNHATREIAATHGVTIATVRSQIQAIRDKVGVRSIGALVLKATEVPLVFAIH